MNNIKDEIMPSLFEKYPSLSALYEGQNREAAKVMNSAKVVFPIIIIINLYSYCLYL